MKEPESKLLIFRIQVMEWICSAMATAMVFAATAAAASVLLDEHLICPGCMTTQRANRATCILHLGGLRASGLTFKN